jgi:hypothetical protein
MHNDILRRLRDAVRRKCPEKWKISRWFLLHDNAPAHRSVSVNDFLAKNNCDKTRIDFHLFPQMKSTFAGRGVCEATDIIKTATEELKRLSQNDLQECLYSRWKKCIAAKWDYFERNVLFCTSQK